MKEIFTRVKESFKKATKGQENVSIMIWRWGVISYLMAYFIAENLIMKIDYVIIDILISLLMSVYFAWHFYALKRCAPKKQKITPEEKERMREERRKDAGKKFLRKLFLQEPIGKWDPVLVTLVADVFCISHFLGYVFR